MKPHALIFSGFGLNCEEETKIAFELAGARASIVHIHDVISRSTILKSFEILAFPGGFSFGDDTGSGTAYALKVKNHLWESLRSWIDRKGLMIGICNGFQILVALGLLPAVDNDFGKQQAALLPNTSLRYTVRWVDVHSEGLSPWLHGLDHVSLPIAHGEGRFYASDDILDKLERKRMVALRRMFWPSLE